MTCIAYRYQFIDITKYLILILISDYAFFDNGPVKGPMVIMTDNCDELKDALHAVWPSSKLFLCVFHLMQQVWRWLFDRKNGILQADRPGN